MAIDVTDLAPRLAELCRKYDIAELAVFGSVARGDERPDSDIDILFTPSPGAQLGFVELGFLQEELETILGRSVDLVSKNGLHWVVRDEILTDAQVFYAA